MNTASEMVVRYSKRGCLSDRYMPTAPDVVLARMERHGHFCRMLHEFEPLRDLRLLEVGAGHGSNLLELLSLGFDPENVIANELQPDRAKGCRRRLPAAVRVIEGDGADAITAGAFREYFDLILFSTVFSSVLETRGRKQLALAAWEQLDRGGAVIVYDFAVNNPRNQDVRGVSLREIRSLFPIASDVRSWRVTLCPPVARLAARLHPLAWRALNLVPVLRTHRITWVRKSSWSGR